MRVRKVQWVVDIKRWRISSLFDVSKILRTILSIGAAANPSLHIVTPARVHRLAKISCVQRSSHDRSARVSPFCAELLARGICPPTLARVLPAGEVLYFRPRRSVDLQKTVRLVGGCRCKYSAHRLLSSGRG